MISIWWSQNLAFRRKKHHDKHLAKTGTTHPEWTILFIEPSCDCSHLWETLQETIHINEQLPSNLFPTSPPHRTKRTHTRHTQQKTPRKLTCYPKIDALENVFHPSKMVIFFGISVKNSGVFFSKIIHPTSDATASSTLNSRISSKVAPGQADPGGNDFCRRNLHMKMQKKRCFILDLLITRLRKKGFWWDKILHHLVVYPSQLVKFHPSQLVPGFGP